LFILLMNIIETQEKKIVCGVGESSNKFRC
jgi:hypothetical protein